MDKGLLDLHNVLRWVIFIVLLASIITAYNGWRGKKPFTPGAKKIWLFTLIFSHVNFLVGLYQMLWGRFGILVVDLPEGESVMKNKFFRFFWVEHPVFMIISIVLITIGYGMAKKPVPDETKYKKAFWFFVIALLMILVAMPWPFREIIGRPLLPGIGQ